MVQRTRTRMTWRSKRVRAGHHPSIGRGIEVVDSADKGRIVVANTTFRRKESILREPTLPLAMFGPGHCFRCAAGILRVNPDGTPAANAQGFCEAVPGTTRCLRCRRIFCSQACQASAQHQCECPVMAHVDTQTPADVCDESQDQTVRAFCVNHCEAVARVVLLPKHHGMLAVQVALLDSSYPRAPFGEQKEALARCFGRYGDQRPLWIALLEVASFVFSGSPLSSTVSA